MIIPRVLVSSSNPDMSCKILGRKCNYPFGFAPTAMNQIANELGENVPAIIAKEYSLAYCLSLLSTTSFSDIRQANGSGLRLMQMYVSVDW
jgi:isopentenyl diphosphate isomerase/L-lactate dehydrogenase-like FMN-dependent dehydrogenase